MTQDAAWRQEYVPTGVAGLDAVLCGGLLREGFYLLQGDPGAGKTTLALQFARECALRREAVLYITVTESRFDLERTARSHGWTLDDVTVYDLSRSDASLNPEALPVSVPFGAKPVVKGPVRQPMDCRTPESV